MESFFSFDLWATPANIFLMLFVRLNLFFRGFALYRVFLHVLPEPASVRYHVEMGPASAVRASERAYPGTELAHLFG